MDEKLYKRIADEYMEEYGKRLRGELNTLERDSTPRITPAMDRRVRDGIAAKRRARHVRYAGLAAACLMIALLTPVFLRFSSGGGAASAPGTQASAPPASSAPASPAPSAPAASAPAASAPSAPAPSSPSYDILPLPLNLPVRFTVASVEQDIGETIYYLKDDEQDDVIMTLERSGDLSRYDDLVALSVGGRGAFGSSGGGYSLLAFMDVDSDILYVLTCKYDVNTLMLLGESILG